MKRENSPMIGSGKGDQIAGKRVVVIFSDFEKFKVSPGSSQHRTIQATFQEAKKSRPSAL